MRDKHNVWEVPWEWTDDEMDYALSLSRWMAYEHKRHIARKETLYSIHRLKLQMRSQHYFIDSRREWMSRPNFVHDLRTSVAWTAQIHSAEGEIKAIEQKIKRAQRML